MRIRIKTIGLLTLGAGMLLSGCGTYTRHGLDPARVQQIETTILAPPPALTREREDQILALNPEHVTERDVREVLAGMPAPHFVNIHGGIAKVIPRMVSFSEFLIGMGYPGQSITNPSDGTYSFSCYESAEKIAGVMAWYYERDGLRPMLTGHSQGGMQVVKVLYKFAGHSPLHVWNPLTWEEEKRCVITDPLTGKERPVAGLHQGAGAAGARGERGQGHEADAESREIAHDTPIHDRPPGRSPLSSVLFPHLEIDVRAAATASRSTPSSQPSRSLPISIMHLYMTGPPLSGGATPPCLQLACVWAR